MNTILRLFSDTSIHLRIVSLVSSLVPLTIGAYLGFWSPEGLLLGVAAGLFLGVVFWYETRDPLYREKQFPVTGTQKISYLIVWLGYAVFVGCVVEYVQARTENTAVVSLLATSLDGSFGFLVTYTAVQLIRLWLYMLQGGVVDRFIWRERQTGRKGMIGRAGVARERLAPSGKVFVRGEIWDAVVEGTGVVEAGEEVRVDGIVGLKLYVRSLRAEPTPESDHGPAMDPRRRS